MHSCAQRWHSCRRFVMVPAFCAYLSRVCGGALLDPPDRPQKAMVCPAGAMLLTYATLSCTPHVPAAARFRTEFQPGPLRRSRMADDRPVPRRPHRRRGRHRRPAQRLLHRRQQRRRLEDGRLRPHLEAASSTSQPTGSIGAVAVAPSNPNVLYVGSGEGLQRPDLSVGDGMYKCTDAGKTWRHLGLRDGQQIAAILVDPHNPDRVFVAVLGHPYGPNAERGVFRSTDGGADLAEGALQGRAAPARSTWPSTRATRRTVYAVLWQAQQGPWENGAFSGPNSGLFKSTDGGNTWKQLTGGLPTFAAGLGPHRHRHRAQRSESHVRPGGGRRDRRPLPLRRRRRHLEARQLASTASTAAATTSPACASIRRTTTSSTSPTLPPTAPPTAVTVFTAIKGAPGGDDYHTIWINPAEPRHHPAGGRPGRHHQRQ